MKGFDEDRIICILQIYLIQSIRSKKEEVNTSIFEIYSYENFESFIKQEKQLHVYIYAWTILYSSLRNYVQFCFYTGRAVEWPEEHNAVVTPLRKAASYDPRIAILGIWGDTWLTRGKIRHLRGSAW